MGNEFHEILSQPPDTEVLTYFLYFRFGILQQKIPSIHIIFSTFLGSQSAKKHFSDTELNFEFCYGFLNNFDFEILYFVFILYLQIGWIGKTRNEIVLKGIVIVIFTNSNIFLRIKNYKSMSHNFHLKY